MSNCKAQGRREHSPVVPELLLYHLLHVDRVLDHLRHDGGIVGRVIAARGHMVAAAVAVLAVARLVGVGRGGHGLSGNRHWIIAHAGRHEGGRRRLVVVFQLGEVEFPLLGMQPGRLRRICRLLNHSGTQIPIDDAGWDREGVLCIGRRCRARNDDRTRGLVACVDGLRHDEQLMLLVIDGSHTADYRGWDLQLMF